jgi:GNAT superfamily N-acetyltransferase
MGDIEEREHLHRVLLETDRLYFSLGATRCSNSGLDLMYIPGHTTTPSGSVIWGVNRLCTEDRFRRMLASAEAELGSLGGRTMRVYVEDPVPAQISRAFQGAGYRARVEVALLADIPAILADSAADKMYDFVKVETPEHWKLKTLLHAADDRQADGYAASADDWVELERLKCRSGGMSCFLVLRGQEPIAAVGLILDRGVARLKNLYVGPACRKGGIGLATIRFLAAWAYALGYEWFGCFALENGNAIRVYERAGLRVVASATEFSRELSS